MAAKRAQKFRYDYARPALTVDLVVATREPEPRVLLIRRAHDPFAGSWALPGGFVDENEPLAAAARRETREETGVTVADVEQLYTRYGPMVLRRCRGLLRSNLPTNGDAMKQPFR